MSGKQIHLSTGDESTLVYQISEKNMATLLDSIEEIVGRAVDERMRLVNEKPMDVDGVARFLGITAHTVRVKTRQGLLPSHQLDTGAASPHRFYYASEINEKIKGKKK